MFLTKSSSYVLSSTYSGQKDNTVMCLQEVLKKRWIISLQSAEAYDLRRREIGKRKKESFRFPIVHRALHYFHFNWNTQIELLHAEERGRKL